MAGILTDLSRAPESSFRYVLLMWDTGGLKVDCTRTAHTISFSADVMLLSILISGEHSCVTIPPPNNPPVDQQQRQDASNV